MGAAAATAPWPSPVHGVRLVAAGFAERVVLPSTVDSAPRVDRSGVDGRGTQWDGVGVRRGRSRRGRAVVEVILIAPGVALAAIGDYLSENAGSPSSPGTDGPFADGGEALIALTGMAYVGGAILVLCLLLLAPTVRRGFLGSRAAQGATTID